MDLIDTGWRGRIGPRALYRSQVSIWGNYERSDFKGQLLLFVNINILCKV